MSFIYNRLARLWHDKVESGPSQLPLVAGGISMPLVLFLLDLLAQADAMGKALGWSLLLIVLVVAAFFAVVRLRQWLKEDQAVGEKPIGFTLSDLRRLHRDGKISDAEFERARSKMVDAGKAMAHQMPDPLAGSQKRKADLGGSDSETGSKKEPT